MPSRRTCPTTSSSRELLTASGSNFRVPPVNFYRAMQNREPAGIAQTVALTFMGTRADKWPKERLAGMAAFFSQVGYKSTAEWKEEIVFFDPGQGHDQRGGGDGLPGRHAGSAVPGQRPARGLRRLAD